tara:strand:- start:11310 stop:12182 length:873 start_codon:yes stop_codon:yes gene_type:complete
MGIRKKFNLGKIIIGTANFGNKYGFKKKKLNKKEISKILNYSNKFGIKTIDTAINYGNSEKEIGKCKNNNLKIISKIPEIPENLSRIDTYVNKLINRSIKNLKVKKLYGVLIHNAEDLLSEKGSEIYDSLLKIKKKKLIKKIGVSIYNFNLINILIKKYKFDIIQVPFNLIDRRLMNKSTLRKLKNKKIEIHARSIFLKGLLLYEKPPKKFKKWNFLWKKINKFKTENKTNNLEICLNFIQKFDFADKFIIGIDNIEHLKEIIKILKINQNLRIPLVKCGDKKLINPTLW